ncbi:MAG: cysteine--tRNA ligase, partial [Clostridia bacterium]|nr:cysteine--tRNA ligase [Clostridia bacterium]
DFTKAIADDINTPLALSYLWGALKVWPASKDIYNLALDFDKFLGLRLDEIKEETSEIPTEI